MFIYFFKGQLLTGKPVDIDHRENVDLIVVGCVAVSPKGKIGIRVF